MTAAPAGFGFADWFAPLTLPEFNRDVLGRRTLLTPPRPELAERLSQALDIRTAQDLLDKRVRQVSAWFPRLDGAISSAIIQPDTAKRFYDAGTTLFYQEVAEFDPFAREAAAAFGVSAKSAKCQLFCNRPGAVTAVHFDPIDVVTVQLSGRKTWRVAPNSFAPAPLEGWSTKESVPPVLRLYADGPRPTAIPDDATEFVLEPGAVLHVPRGYWHETASDQDSISLHILLIPPLRLDFLLAALRNELLRDPYWRESAYDCSGFDWLHPARDAFATAVDRIDIADLTRAPLPDHPVQLGTTFVRAGQSCLSIESADATSARIALTAFGFSETTTATTSVDRRLLPPCRWLNTLETGTRVDVADLVAAFPELAKPDACDLLALFERTRLLRRC
ncbi:JmjC domain-containing protein [Nocardia brasiliensis]|uniref:JmjC domain-containing protein n=1 Tax=Nocardia brasiliensis TaxID=37326 RepID=UPI002457FC30|nr:cupin domain-containing protein [Nocardia brasiliensis]